MNAERLRTVRAFFGGRVKEPAAKGTHPKMDASSQSRPACFGDVEKVFPKGEQGLRCSPEECMVCPQKTACLRAAMDGLVGLKIREEMIDRAYTSGMVGFFKRWSSKKQLHRRIGRSRKTADSGGEHAND